MSGFSPLVVALMGILILLDGAILLATFLTKFLSRRAWRRRAKQESLIRRSLVAGHLEDTGELTGRERFDFLNAWAKTEQSVIVPEAINGEFTGLVGSWDILPRVEALLKSRFFKKRARGVGLLLAIGPISEPELLRKTLGREKSMLLKLRIVQNLCERDIKQGVDIIRDSMSDSGENYRLWVLRMLRDRHMILDDWVEANREREDRDTRRIIIQAARSKMRPWYHPYLQKMVLEGEEVLAEEAAEVLMESYGDRDSLEFLIRSSRSRQKGKAVFLYFRNSPLPGKEETAEYLGREEFHGPVVAGLTERLGETPRLVPLLYQRYRESTGESEKRGYAAVLASRISYFILRLNGEDRKGIGELLRDAVRLGFSAPLINFLNDNKNLTLEKELLALIVPLIGEDGSFRRQCQLFLKEDLKDQLRLGPPEEEAKQARMQLTRKDRMIMVFMILFVVTLPLAYFFYTQGAYLPFMTGEEGVVAFLLMYHQAFAVYTIAINLVYLFLLVQSWIAIRGQQDEWGSVDEGFLNARGLMPSVSILAPAYNEETTIVQNVYSLLSLNYPNLEVIVINDGSRDRTMERLIEHFDLKLVDYSLSGQLRTAPVLGIYKNDTIPNLLVINKRNGGKADALNVGLNASRGEYVCSIDADSLLEPDALTRLMFRILNHPEKTVAIGGNIIPVNGCVTRNGSIKEIHLSDNRLARYQTIEYLRSFITGRLGWTRMNGLMIISGAFGAFYRQDVVDIGGYMTGAGSLAKDTVGEDMELVVRLIRHLNEKGEKFRIDYAHNANCWTEVPEKMGDLLKQRDRWHRGLIEILIYHRVMLLNRSYGAPGLLTYPYFIIFELLGPFWEFFGYCVLLFSLIFGLLSGNVFLFMFTIVILLGILISALALFLAERDILYFQGKEFYRSMATVIEENFGYRQLVSMHRVYAFVAYLFRDKGWQKLTRKGFATGGEGKSS